MARNETEDDSLAGNLRAPFLFVPHGQTPSAAWLAEHPDWIEIPATFVPRGGTRRTRGGAPWPTSAGGQPWPADRFGNPYRPFSDYGPDERAPGEGFADPLPAMPDTDAAIAAFLQADATIRAVTGGGATPVAAPSGDPAAPVPLVDDEGNAVLDKDDKPILRPASFDPHFFVAEGLKDGKLLREALALPGGIQAVLAATSRISLHLAEFLWGLPWDAQRFDSKFYVEYRDFATIVIGLYAAAAGLRRDDILSLENLAAFLHSNFTKERKYDETYKSLP